jgi:DNA invertase Pin-like site-specific DNA recombinase
MTANTPNKKIRTAIYLRVSTVDQNEAMQRNELRDMAQQRGWQVVDEYTDHISGAKARRPALDRLLSDARRGRIDLVLVWACDRLARSTRHFLELLDEFQRMNIAFISLRENIDTAGPTGKALVTIIGAIAELERGLIVERVRAGMRRAKLDGRKIGRPALTVDAEQIRYDRDQLHYSLKKIAKIHGISKTTVGRILKHCSGPGPQGVTQLKLQGYENTHSQPAA